MRGMGKSQPQRVIVPTAPNEVEAAINEMGCSRNSQASTANHCERSKCGASFSFFSKSGLKHTRSDYAGEPKKIAV